MKILVISDEESPALWDFFTPEKLKGIDLIISCGDLKSSYLQFLVTMARCPLLYVAGNHDGHYQKEPPEGCDCIDDRIVTFGPLRILGLGGCRQYHPGPYQFTEEEMRRRIRLLRGKLKSAPIDILVTHAPPEGLGDGEDPAHKGFAALREFLDEFHPRYLLHGHVHLRYGSNIPRQREYGGTILVNGCERYVLEIPDVQIPPYTQVEEAVYPWWGKRLLRSWMKREN